MDPRREVIASATLVLLALAAGCTKDDPNKLNPTGGATAGCPETTTSGGPGSGSSGSGSTSSSSSGSATSSSSTGGPPHTVLDDRVVRYPEALRTASLKLVGNAPSLADIQTLASAKDPKTQYEAMIDAMMADARFAKTMLRFWKNTMRMGGPAAGMKPSRDTAPTFAARIVFEGRPYTDLFTATQHTCPTFDGTQFADGECSNGPITAGILTDPGVQAQYYSNLAMRRVRFFQETFACKKQPAELSNMPKKMGAGTYTSPWPFTSISGSVSMTGRIDFQDTSSAICANCHTTSNHRAPLMANFDENGQYQSTIQVKVPVMGVPTADMTDWLPPGEPTAWKFGVPVKDLAEMGAAMAADDEVATCAVARVWNYAMSKGDIVTDAADVPTSVISDLVKSFKGSGYNLRATVRAAFVHDDFVRY